MAAASLVARYFLARSDPDEGDNLKLQKLLYYAQGFHLAIMKRQLFDDPIEAWRHGPVVRKVYAEYANYGANAIPPPDQFDARQLTEDERSLLDEVYRVYGQYSGWRLREMTHSEPPWLDAWRADAPVISHTAMQEFFSTLVEE